MTDEEMKDERRKLMRAIHRRNEDLRRLKEERGYYKHQADSANRWSEQLNLALKIACEAIPKPLLKSGTALNEPGVFMAMAGKQLRERREHDD